jgi:hypothetical protein
LEAGRMPAVPGKRYALGMGGDGENAPSPSLGDLQKAA